jgi:hypothetical protein
MPWLNRCQPELVFDVEQGDLDIAHGHFGRLVAQQFHENRQAYAGPNHFRRVGVPELVGHDASADTGSAGDLMKRTPYRGAERHTATGARQKIAVGLRVPGAQRTKAIQNSADKGLHWNHAFGLQFAEGHMNRPLILTDAAQAIRRQIEAFADAHTCIPEEQQSIAVAIVAACQLLPDQPVLFGIQRSRQTAVLARDIVGAYQTSQGAEPLWSRPVLPECGAAG